MNEQENTKTVQQAYDYFKSGNIEGVLSLMSNDVDWRLPNIENMPHAGTRKGLEQVTEFFSTLAEVQDAKQFDPNEFIAQGDRVVALGHYIWKVKANNREYSDSFSFTCATANEGLTNTSTYARDYGISKDTNSQTVGGKQLGLSRKISVIFDYATACPEEL